MKVAATIAFCISALGFLSAIPTIAKGIATEKPEHLVGYIVGVFLLPVGSLILGLYLWKKAEQSNVIPAEVVDDPSQRPSQ
jgi:hypothetical protein